MEFKLETIEAIKSRSKKRVGRGNGSGRGTYSGRGLKGQRSRSGGKSGTKRRGFKMSLQKIPKLRGFKSMAPKKETVTLSMLEKVCNNDDVVTPFFLEDKGIISKPKVGVKIVASGVITKKLQIKNCLATKGAAEAIEKVGGSITF